MDNARGGTKVDQQTKQLIGHIKSDPWVAIEWKACHIEKVATAYIDLIDDAIFQRDRVRSLQLAFILRGLSRKINDRVACKAEACLGSAFGILLNQFDLAVTQMEQSEAMAGSHDDCLGAVYSRWGLILFYQYQFDDALSYFDDALSRFENLGDEAAMCSALLHRSGTFRMLNKYAEGMESIKTALPLMKSETPSRFFMAAAVNAISLAAASDDTGNYNAALSIVDKLRDEIKGRGGMHSSARGVLRWVRGLAYEKLCDMKNAIRCTESALSTFERRAMREEKKVAMADLARMRRKGKQREVNNRHIRRLIDASLSLDIDEETEAILLRAKRNPSEENILAWRNSLESYVPSLEPEPEKKALV